MFRNDRHETRSMVSCLSQSQKTPPPPPRETPQTLPAAIPQHTRERILNLTHVEGAHRSRFVSRRVQPGVDASLEVVRCEHRVERLLVPVYRPQVSATQGERELRVAYWRKGWRVIGKGRMTSHKTSSQESRTPNRARHKGLNPIFNTQAITILEYSVRVVLTAL